MATFRKIHTEFWTDPRVLEEMTPEDRYFYLYLLTNSHTTQIGIYPISKKVMGFELGYSTESINSLMDRFENHHKLIKYNADTRELAIINWGEYNLNRGGKPMEDCIKKELSAVKDISLIHLVSEKVPCESLKTLFLEYKQHDEEFLKVSETVETPEKVESFDDTLHDTSTSRGQEKEEDKEEDKDKDKDKDKEKEIKPECRNKLQPVFDAWNKLNLQKLVQIKPSSNRYTLLNARIKEYGLDTVLEAIEQVHKSDFLRGQNERGWCITFDWFIKPNNFIKVLEGNYKSEGSKTKQNNSVPANKSIDPLEARLQARLQEKLKNKDTSTSEAISQRMAELGIGGKL